MSALINDLMNNTHEVPGKRASLVLGGLNNSSITDRVCEIAEAPTPPRAWYIAFAVSSSLTLMLFGLVGYLIFTGVGVWGNNAPVFWAWDIVNFVFWVGIGHAGTLISAILFLFRQNWRTSINRFAEAMTIFAVICAGLFPTVHVGRIWVIYWLLPLPNQNAIWPNFRSPLLWDVFAVRPEPARDGKLQGRVGRDVHQFLYRAFTERRRTDQYRFTVALECESENF